MSKFRKLKDGYEYVVGKHNLVIRNKEQKYHKVIPKKEIGYLWRKDTYIITPGMIRDYIEKGASNDDKWVYFDPCSCDSTPKRICYNPFSAEIYGIRRLTALCDSCHHESCMAI